MAKQTTTTMTVEGIDIRFYGNLSKEYISLTDMAKHNSNRPEQVIQNWLRSRNTIEFLGLWEKLYNKDFNHLEFEVVKTKTGLNSFALSVSDWTGSTGLLAFSQNQDGTVAVLLPIKILLLSSVLGSILLLNY